MSTQQVEVGARRVRGLRANSFAAVIILLVEYGFGVWVNLYGNLPMSDKGTNIASGFSHAVANGPVGLSIHALLGVVLMISGTSALVRAVATGSPVLVGATAVGLTAILVAAVSGATFVGHMKDAASMSMAVGAAVAIGAYCVVLFTSGATARALR